MVNDLLQSKDVTMFDYKYLELMHEILTKGSLRHNRTGIDTYSLPQKVLSFDLEKEGFPILQSKFVAFKTAIKELLWIWQMKSNSVDELNKMNVKIWDEWKKEDGTIGYAYGYQLAKNHLYTDIDPEIIRRDYIELESNIIFSNGFSGKPKQIIEIVDGKGVKMTQVDKLIYDLKYNRDSRRMVVSLWNPSEVHNMALYPCAYETLWNASVDKLNCTLIIRSNDIFLGNPFNVSQYAALVHIMAHCTGLNPGKFMVYMNDAHIYSNHVKACMTQVGLVDNIAIETDYNKYINGDIEYPFHKVKLTLPEDKTNFYELTPDDIKLIGYVPGEKISAPVAI